MIAEIFRIVTENPTQLIGWAIMGGLLVQVGLLVTAGAQRALFERQRAQQEQVRLALEIKAARLKIQAVETEKTAWNGIRKFTVAQKVKEAEDTFSFYLEPHDRKPLPQFKPGQYLTFALNIPGSAKQVVRCYSLSDIGRRTHYRVTIKRCLPPPKTEHPPGVGSSFFCDTVQAGDIVDAKAPNGHFFLDMEKPRPVVLISGGIGVTPMVTMANALTEAGDTREIWFFFGARNSTDHMFKTYMTEIAAKNPNVHMQVCYSKPLPTDVKGRDYQHEGRVTVDLFKALLPSNNYDYFLCGPGPFMESITSDLTAWGVPDAWVHFEAFGPASVKKKAPAKTADAGAPAATAVEVTFAKSGKKVLWDGSHDSVLALADEHGVKIDAGCRAGGCGSCVVAIKSGAVEYAGAPPEVEAGSCLSCICKPKGALVIDA
ncbi:MAG: 2Fe-2S iron-sulfur cluster binding domain-containing protein [Opitutae bacterium]|nr:2Fe-2S iron-sulfur cluster binding domain-containing protein [Opitutae bacterium]